MRKDKHKLKATRQWKKKNGLLNTVKQTPVELEPQRALVLDQEEPVDQVQELLDQLERASSLSLLIIAEMPSYSTGFFQLAQEKQIEKESNVVELDMGYIETLLDNFDAFELVDPEESFISKEIRQERLNSKIEKPVENTKFDITFEKLKAQTPDPIINPLVELPKTKPATDKMEEFLDSLI